MKIEIRADSVLIDGYVNAVERESKTLRNAEGQFVEKIRAGAFKRSLERAKRTGYAVKVLLNHDYGKELTSTRESTTKIYEDNIGLRCQCEIRDAEVVEKARAGKLVGWSFGFLPIKDKWEKDGDVAKRELSELELKEVSILDDSKVPAYNGTSIETRQDELIELRAMDDDVETVDTKKQDKNYKLKNRALITRVGA